MVQENTFLCFFIMPFSSQFNFMYEFLKKRIESQRDNKIKVFRADSHHSTKPMLEKITSDIEMANVIVADTTDFKPNVFFELGIAYSKQEKVILIANYELTKIPTDLNQYEFISYQNKTPEEFFSKLKEAINNIIENKDGEYYKFAVRYFNEFKTEYDLDIEPNEEKVFLQFLNKDKEIGNIPNLNAPPNSLKAFLVPKIIKAQDNENPEINQQYNEWVSPIESS